MGKLVPGARITVRLHGGPLAHQRQVVVVHGLTVTQRTQCKGFAVLGKAAMQAALLPHGNAKE